MTRCDRCKAVVLVGVLVEVQRRIRWGAAVRRGWGTGYSDRNEWWCECCRSRYRGAWRHAKVQGG